MRKRFTFSLQKVLDYKAGLQEEAQLELARARKKYQAQIALIKSLEDELAQAREEISKKENVTQGRIWLWNRYIERLNFDQKSATRKLKELAREVSLRRHDLLEKTKDKKILEKLKVNQKIRFYHEQEKEEQKEYDEMAVVRYKPEAV